MQDRDAVGNAHHELHLVLDDEDGPPLGEGADEHHGRVRLLGAHARRRLVEEEQGRLGREGDGDLEVTLLAMGEKGGHALGLLAEAHRIEDNPGALPRRAQTIGSRPEVEGVRIPLRGHAHVLEHAEMRKDIGDLVGLGDAEPGHRVLRQPRDLPAFELDAARARRHLARDQAKQRRLPRPVGADDRAKLARANGEGDVLHGGEAAEVATQPFGTQQNAVVHCG